MNITIKQNIIAKVRILCSFTDLMNLFLRVLSSFFIFLFCINATAVKKNTPTPTRIRSDIIDIKRKQQLMIFLGNVVVEKDDSSLLAQKMYVIYKETKANGAKKTEIKRIDAEDNVKIFSEEFIGSGDIGHFEPENNLFILEKNVIVNNGTSIANGDKFVYHTITKKGNFVGKKNESVLDETNEDNRVIMVIGDGMSKQKKSNKKSKNDSKNSKR